MAILILFVFLLVFEIILLIKSVKNNNNKNWLLLFSIETLSIICGLLTIYYGINTDYLGWAFLYYILLSLVHISSSSIILIISIIFKIVEFRKNKKNGIIKEKLNKDFIAKSIIFSVIFILSLFALTIYLEDLPHKKQQIADQRKEEQANIYVIDYLNKRYGNGDYKIINFSSGNICSGCSWLDDGIDGYSFTITSSYIESNFTVQLENLETNDFKVYTDTFLDIYYKEKYKINDLKNYLIEYKISNLNEDISKNFDASITFNNTSVDNYGYENYGKIPTIDELSNLVELSDPKFDINENIATKEDLLEYLVKFTKYFIKDLDKTNITYSQENKYFRYKYDFSKIGVYNYIDQYNGYVGYVYAGDYTYSEEKGHYILENADSIVRINVVGNVTTYKLKDILGE